MFGRGKKIGDEKGGRMFVENLFGKCPKKLLGYLLLLLLTFKLDLAKLLGFRLPLLHASLHIADWKKNQIFFFLILRWHELLGKVILILEAHKLSFRKFLLITYWPLLNELFLLLDLFSNNSVKARQSKNEHFFSLKQCMKVWSLQITLIIAKIFSLVPSF